MFKGGKVASLTGAKRLTEGVDIGDIEEGRMLEAVLRIWHHLKSHSEGNGEPLIVS